jgi:hypothetical protein
MFFSKYCRLLYIIKCWKFFIQSTVAISQSPAVSTISPTVSSGGSETDVCALAPDPYICSRSQDRGFGSPVATNKEDVKSYLFFLVGTKKERKKI